MDYSKHIQDYLNKEKEVIDSLNIDEINEAMQKIIETYENEGTIYIFGNGGSATTASHFVGDFNKGVSEFTEKKFRFVCLNDNPATVLAIANDIGYEEIFRFQLRNKVTQNDLVIGISGSGNSMNVVNAIDYANSCGVATIGVTGYDGGKVRKMSKYHMHVPVDNMQFTEDVHLIFDHMMMTILYQVWNLKGHC